MALPVHIMTLQLAIVATNQVILLLIALLPLQYKLDLPMARLLPL